MDTLAQDLLEQLECPVCMEYMIPPIMQCVRGHSVCNKCREQLTNCSLCREKYTETRSVNLEKMARKLKYPCKYKDAGCVLTLNPDQMAAHQVMCDYGRKCPLSLTSNKCKWQGSYKDMKAHVKTAHTEPGETREMSGKYRCTNPDMSQNAKWYQVVIMQDELFLSYTKTTEDALFSVLLYVGDEDKSKKFQYELSFTTADGSKRVTTTHVTPSYCRGIDDLFNEENCMFVSYKFVKQCVNTKNELPYEVNVFKMR